MILQLLLSIAISLSFASPVGSLQERESGEIWPGHWQDANPYLNFYTYGSNNQYSAYHTGADLNLNDPNWNSDKGLSVYAVANGIVTFAKYVPAPSTWGRLIVIRHKLSGGRYIHSRYAHLATITVSAGDVVSIGQQIGTIGGSEYGVPDHLHLDISHSGILESNPTYWPGTHRQGVIDNFLDPKEFLRKHAS